MTNVYTSAIGAVQTTGEIMQSTNPAVLSERFGVFDLLRMQNGAKSVSETDDDARIPIKNTDTSFSGILIESFSGRSGERAIRRAQDAAADLKRYGGETRGASGKTDNPAAERKRKYAADANRAVEQTIYGEKDRPGENNVRTEKTHQAVKMRAVKNTTPSQKTAPAGNNNEQDERQVNETNAFSGTYDSNETPEIRVPELNGNSADYFDAEAENTAVNAESKPMADVMPAFFTDGLGETNAENIISAIFTKDNGEVPATPDDTFNAFIDEYADSSVASDTPDGSTITDTAPRAITSPGAGVTAVLGTADGTGYTVASDFENTIEQITGTAVNVRVADYREAPVITAEANAYRERLTAGLRDVDAGENNASVSQSAEATVHYLNSDQENGVTLPLTVQEGITANYLETTDENGVATAAEVTFYGNVPTAISQDASGARDGNSGFNMDADMQNGGNSQNGAGSEGLNASVDYSADVHGANPFQTAQSPNAGSDASAARIPKTTLTELIPEFYEDLSREAKIVLDGGKHEFLMQLKPDNLGKVIMRVMTENGLVSARFVVENEQARSALEENLAGLNEALGELGMNIRDCSVEVRNGGDQASGYQGLADAGRRNRKTNSTAGESGTAIVLDAGMRAFLRNRYYEQQSSVHFTA